MDFEIGSIANLILGNKTPSGLKKKKKSKTSGKVVVNFESVQLDSKKDQRNRTDPESFEADLNKLHKGKVKSKKRAKSGDEAQISDDVTSQKHKKKKKHEEDTEERPTNASYAEKRIQKKNKEILRKNFQDSHSEREIFVGNVPINIKKKKLISLFSQFGDIETVRLRGAPLSDPRIPKKVAVIKKKFHPDRSSLNAYVRFINIDSVNKAITANGMLFEDHHLRVTTAAEPLERDTRKAIFVGNFPFDGEDDDLWKMFGECGTVTSVRIMRDKITGVSRGAAYVNFESADSVELALKLDGEQLKKRKLRVRRCAGMKNKQINHRPRPKGVETKQRQFQHENDSNVPKKKKKNKLQGENVNDGRISKKVNQPSDITDDDTHLKKESKKNFKLKKSFQGQKVAEKKGKIKHKKKKNKENLKKRSLISKIGEMSVAEKKVKPTFPAKKIKSKPFVTKMRSKTKKNVGEMV